MCFTTVLKVYCGNPLKCSRRGQVVIKILLVSEPNSTCTLAHAEKNVNKTELLTQVPSNVHCSQTAKYKIARMGFSQKEHGDLVTHRD